jgi:DNA polymerase elongation subunit (family B)
MFLSIRYDTFAKKYNSYGLKNIIKQENLERIDRVAYDASQIRFNYKNPVEWAKIKEYCKHDAEDSLKLYDLMIAPSFYSSQYIPKPFQNLLVTATGSKINYMMVRSYLQIAHSIPKADSSRSFEGAISRGKPGIYKNCVRWDVASLYPSIMLQYAVCDEKKDPKRHFLKLLEVLTAERLKNKKIAKDQNSKYHDDLQNALKELINSFYGFLAAEGLNFNSVECADFVTRTGRQILSMAIEWATKDTFENWDRQFNE